MIKFSTPGRGNVFAALELPEKPLRIVASLRK
jgi:hypothetical protein